MLSRFQGMCVTLTISALNDHVGLAWRHGAMKLGRCPGDGGGPARESSSMNDVTHILSAIEDGDAKAAEQLLPLVYDELRRLAAQRLAQEKPGQTLQATALVHEAYLRLVDIEKVQHWNSR